MLIKNMTAEECRELLIHASFGSLGCAQDNQPYVVPIYFAYEPDRLYGFSTLGKKIKWMRVNPRVCVTVAEVTNHVQWKSVVVSGRYEELTDTPQHSAERLQAQKSFEKRYLWWQAAYAANQLRRNREEEQLFYCIHIEDIAGRSAMPDSVESRIPL